ncbi:MAG: tetratricopeptide repeat protein [Bacteroidetes bacterium]|nr:tetratricopeptide repeat protein [Bacteroidota bacterium]
MARYCTTCGSAVTATDTVCPVCGEPIEPAEATKAAASSDALPAQSDPLEELGTADAAAAGRQEAPPPSSAMRDYLLAGIGAAVLAVIVFIVSSPEERKGPPIDMQAQASAQAPHSQMETPAPPGPTPEQRAQIAELEKQVAAQPNDLDASLKLANLYYDTEEHQKALPLYAAYLKAHPDNSDVRTDMAFSMAASGDVSGGISQLRGVLHKNPKQQKASFNLAVMYMMKRDRDSTMYWIRRVVAIDSTTPVGRNAAAILRDVETKRLQSDSGSAPADGPASGQPGGGAR